jgi:probable phosphoglycerate mutase
LVTAELAGLAVDEVSPVLAEWDYGDYEGLTTPEIRTTLPDWTVWAYGCPNGESVDAVTVRADRAVSLGLSHMESRDVVFVGHGHFSRAVMRCPRAFGCRWPPPRSRFADSNTGSGSSLHWA